MRYNPGTNYIQCYHEGKWQDVVFAGISGGFSTKNWIGIKNIVNAGQESKYFSVGDEVPVTLSTGEKVSFRVAAINHDATHQIIFDTPKTLAATRQMNSTLNSKGGYASMELRAWLNGQFFATLPEDLQKVITARKFAVLNTPSTVTTITDKVWVPRITEILPGSGGMAKEVSLAKTTRFAIYLSAGTKKNYRWWSASMQTEAGHWYWVDENGACNYSGVHNALGVSPCFQIAAD